MTCLISAPLIFAFWLLHWDSAVTILIRFSFVISIFVARSGLFRDHSHLGPMQELSSVNLMYDIQLQELSSVNLMYDIMQMNKIFCPSVRADLSRPSPIHRPSLAVPLSE